MKWVAIAASTSVEEPVFKIAVFGPFDTQAQASDYAAANWSTERAWSIAELNEPED